MTKPRVLFLCPSLETGGAERQLALLAPALARRGLDVRIVTIRSRGRLFDELAAKGVDVRFSEVRSRFDLAGIHRVLRRARSWPELVVSQSIDAQLVAAVLARREGIPHLTIHHKNPELVLAPHRRLLTRLVAPRIDAVVAVTGAQVDNLVESGFSRARIRLIENGVDGERTTRPRSLVRAELGLSEGDFVALLPATLRPEKRPEVFLAAVAAANKRNPSVRGLIAGGGPDLERISAAAHDVQAVKVLGERADIEDVIAASDIVCLTSVAEALPMVVLEAMALGKPVVSTSVGGIPEAVGDGQAGLLLPIDEGDALTAALIRLAGDDEAVQAMGRTARARYEARYSSEQMADRYRDLVLELLHAA